LPPTALCARCVVKCLRGSVRLAARAQTAACSHGRVSSARRCLLALEACAVLIGVTIATSHGSALIEGSFRVALLTKTTWCCKRAARGAARHATARGARGRGGLACWSCAAVRAAPLAALAEC
jgi:hypothetical protein